MHGNRWQNENDSGKAMSKILACWGFFVFGKSKVLEGETSTFIFQIKQVFRVFPKRGTSFVLTHTHSLV